MPVPPVIERWRPEYPMNKRREPAEMPSGLFRRDGDYRYARAVTDRFSDVECGRLCLL